MQYVDFVFRFRFAACWTPSFSLIFFFFFTKHALVGIDLQRAIGPLIDALGITVNFFPHFRQISSSVIRPSPYFNFNSSSTSVLRPFAEGHSKELVCYS